MSEWIGFYFGEQLIVKRLGLSRGAAQAKLRELCAAGLVRSRKQPYSQSPDNFFEPQIEGEWEPIQPCEWWSHQIDMMTDGDGCRYFVEVSDSDLSHWLDQQVPKEPKDKREEAIIKRLKAERPGKPGGITWPVFCEAIRKDTGKKATERGYSDERIEDLTRQIMKRPKSVKVGQPKTT
jgi:hypothetical protein